MTRLEHIRRECAFLLDRLTDFEAEHVDDTSIRDWTGHVAPSMERLRGLIIPPEDGAR